MKTNMEKLCDDLSKFDYEPFMGYLKSECGDGFCCLGRATELFTNEGGNGRWVDRTINNQCWIENDRAGRCDAYLPTAVAKWLFDKDKSVDAPDTTNLTCDPWLILDQDGWDKITLAREESNIKTSEAWNDDLTFRWFTTDDTDDESTRIVTLSSINDFGTPHPLISELIRDYEIGWRSALTYINQLLNDGVATNSGRETYYAETDSGF